MADLGLAFICYLFAKKIVPKNKKIKLLASVLILFNPAFIFNSALWGQIDSLPIFFVLWSAYLLLYSKKDIISALLFTVAILIKPTALVFLPVYAVLFIKKFGVRRSLLNLIVANIFFIISFIPFMKDKNILTYPYELYTKGILAAQSLPFVTNGAFNFWAIVTGFKGIKDTVPLIWGISYRLIGYVVVGLINLFILFRLYRSKIQERTVFAALFLGAFSAFLFLTKMHERYSLLPLVFLLLFSLKNPKNFFWFILLSIIGLINHYHSWAVPWIPSLAGIIRSGPFIFIISLLNLTVFFYFLRIFIVNIRRLGSLDS
jgi:Gpi18-like mannosyltransferase